MKHERFHYKTLKDIQEQSEKLNLHLPLRHDVSNLADGLEIEGIGKWQNRLGIAPMEGADSLPDGSPSELTLRRYVNEAIGGSSVLWFEAISIVPEARSSAHQLMLTQENVDAFKTMNEKIKQEGLKANGFEPYLIMQANHSGRYSNPGGKPAPLIAYRHPAYEAIRPVDDTCIVSDDYLKNLEVAFEKASKLAKDAGFDAIDIKSCHGYLLAELSSAYLRSGDYGGSFDNRTRLLRNAIQGAKVYEDNRFAVTARLGIYDGQPHPYGFGVSTDGSLTPDMTEPIRLVRLLHDDLGLRMLNLTMGNPYVTTHITRPYDSGKYLPNEHPLEGLARMFDGIKAVKDAVPGIIISASAPSYLRQYSGMLTAGTIAEGYCDHMLFGRMAFANPGFANQLIHGEGLDKKKVCIACGKCGDLIRAGKPTGCVVRDSDNYLGYYREISQQ